MIAAIDDAWTTLTGFLFEHAVQPGLYALGLMDWADDLFDWMDFALFGLLGIVLAWALCRPLELWRPVEPETDRRAIGTDMLYTFLVRLGILPLIAFVALASLQARFEGLVADSGWVPPTLEDALPALRENPLLALVVYVIVLDFAEYWRHRLQHSIPWWWALHSVHHAQRQMTFWTDDRNHILDDVIGALWFGAIALAIGVPPGQFPIILMILRIAESLSHANVRLDFGRLGERLLVSPRFHRLHHGLLSAGEHGRNYAVLLPVWDWIFGTADWNRGSYPRTGDPTGSERLATGGWLAQQAEGFRRFWRALRGRAV
jgi:sterol desaturase/sphingolipid hydroxylase (fatty acid hydroxylase superfamily)